MEPIIRKMMIKKVAGFHSVDFGIFVWLMESSPNRRNLGTNDFQKDTLATLGTITSGAPLARRIEVENEARRTVEGT